MGILWLEMRVEDPEVFENVFKWKNAASPSDCVTLSRARTSVGQNEGGWLVCFENSKCEMGGWKRGRSVQKCSKSMPWFCRVRKIDILWL